MENNLLGNLFKGYLVFAVVTPPEQFLVMSRTDIELLREINSSARYRIHPPGHRNGSLDISSYVLYYDILYYYLPVSTASL